MDLSSCGTPEARRDREVFFRSVFGQNEGEFCIGVSIVPPPGSRRKMHQRFFHYPTQLEEALDLIDANIVRADLYFCPQLLNSKEKLSKHTVEMCPSVWADLDNCLPSKLLVEPTIVWETSPNRFQAIWRLEEVAVPQDAESLSRRIAYYHAGDGADRSGWDLTQFLRIPRTGNFKYRDELDPTNPAIVQVVGGTAAKYRPEDFKKYPEVKRAEFLDLPLPEMPTEEPLEIVQRYRRQINPQVFDLFATEPKGTWSEHLWRLLMLCFEAGMELPEVFRVADEAACNKYKRDGRDIEYLWKDVCRAYVRMQQNIGAVVFTAAPQIELITDEEERQAAQQNTFLERYIAWASGLGDAAPQYHQAGAFVALSSILAGHVRLPTSFGTIIPNLWFMILADTTLTRKSTAMDIAMDLVNDVDDDVLLATDGSLEGMMQQLQGRPGRASVFLRDEFAGLLEMMTKRDYYAGMAEMLTKLYDGKIQKRILRRETVEVREPVLIIFAGGIRNRVQGLLTQEHVSSGFIPRFVFITAESNTDRLRPLGPPTEIDMSNRDMLVRELASLMSHYHVEDGDRRTTKKFQAVLTTDAWARYNKLESDMLKAGLASERPDMMTPMFDRLAKSTLKAALLIAASRQRDERVVLEECDLIAALSFGSKWRGYAIEVVNGVGRTAWERETEKILNAVIRHPGITRSKLMQGYHLTAKAADVIFDTLIQRGQIGVSKVGGSTVYHPLEARKK